MNRTSIIGNLGQDAQVRILDNAQAAISFSVATTERWTDKQGEKHERTEWTNCTMWKPADKTSVSQYLTKGMKVLVEGKISARPWTDQQGKNNASLELRVDNLEFLSPAPQQTGQTQSGAPVSNGPGSTPTEQNKEHFEKMDISSSAPAPQANSNEDDLPF